jgi:hypothetical protein
MTDQDKHQQLDQCWIDQLPTGSISSGFNFGAKTDLHQQTSQPLLLLLLPS